MGTPITSGRANQKQRTRMAIIDAARRLIGTGRELTMPDVARAALVSEATAYRYFPDLVSLLQAAFAGMWAEPSESLADIAGCSDPVERVARAAEELLRGVYAYRSAVRAMISGTITRPELASARPGQRFGLIDHALAAPADLSGVSPERLEQLRRDLAIVISAEALFTLTDLYGLPPDEAIRSGVQTARTLTEAAIGSGRG
jgi:AcrR family transcriptional regulator